MHDHETIAAAPASAPRLLRLPDVAGRVALSPRMVQKMAAAGTFPQPLRIGRAVRWREADVTDWIVDGWSSGAARTGRPRRGAGGAQ
jgi:predicted DNA-binding transcriptional regulator AlpA